MKKIYIWVPFIFVVSEGSRILHKIKTAIHPYIYIFRKSVQKQAGSFQARKNEQEEILLDENMMAFSTLICNLGENLPGTSSVLTEEELKALDQADVSVFEDQKIVGAAKLTWNPTTKVLVAMGKHVKNVDHLKLRVEIMALLKDRGIQTTPFDQLKASGAMAEHHDFDPSFPHRIVEVWYDLQNWVRYVWNESRSRQDRGLEETWLPNFIAMDCVGEHEQPQTLSKEEFERTRQDAMARKAYAKVKNVRDKKHINAEDALLVKMQAAYKAGSPRGSVKIQPSTFSESEFEGSWS